ncbi:MAG: metal-dependent amidase/aminoacylase/carboxypeptidase family protein [Paraglaciecola sp.]
MQIDPITNELSPVMHACEHDVHINGLVGTARYMQANLSIWSGTLMSIAPPAEERIMGARKMMEDGIWERFGKPDFALALHVFSELETSKLDVAVGPISAGLTSVDIFVHGVGTHGAYHNSVKILWYQVRKLLWLCKPWCQESLGQKNLT